MTKTYRHKQGEKGFVALVSTLLISAVLLVLMYTTSTGSFYARFDALGSEYKRISVGLSESCSNAALLKITQNYNYTPAVGGDAITVGPDTCLIRSVTYGTEDPVTHRKLATINTDAKYPPFGGSWSTTQIQATIQNPAMSVTVPVPTCSFNSNATSISAGQAVTFGWATAGSATSFSVSRDIGGSLSTIYSGSPSGSPIQDTPTDSATYSATITGLGGSTQCLSPVSVEVQDLSCADVVMMLDRTGSMSATDLTDERIAAKSLLDLYNTLAPNAPQIGIGRFGFSSSNSNAEVQLRGRLTASYGDDDIGSDSDNDLYDAAEEATVSGTNIYTNLASTISIGDGELNSTRHINGKDKVLIIISDGEPNRPCADGSESCGASVTTLARNAATNAANAAKAAHGSDNLPTEIFTIHFGSAGTNNTNRHFLASLASDNSLYDATSLSDTGFNNPTDHFQDGAGVIWSNPTGVYSDGGGSSFDNEGHRHHYRYFNFEDEIPTGSTINGIEIQAHAWSVDPVNSILFDSFGSGSSDSTFGENPPWVEGGAGAEKRAPTSGDDSASPDSGRFAIVFADDGYICKQLDSTGVSNMTLSYNWRGDSDAEMTDLGLVEYATGGTCASPTGRTTLVSHALNTNPNSWNIHNLSLPAALNNDSSWFLILRTNANNSGENFRVDGVSVYTPSGAASTDCRLGVSLSWNGGTTWTTAGTNPTKTQTLTPTESTYTFGDSSDGWGHAWTLGEVDNGSFRLRVHDVDPGPACQNSATTRLDYIRTKIHYTGVNDSAENTDGDHLFIAPTSADMPELFETIGELACPALIPPPPPPPLPPPPSPPPPPPPISIGSWDEIINVP